MELQEDTSCISEVTGDVVITTYPVGAEIYMDDHLVVDDSTKEPIKTPVTLVMYMGYHDLKFTLPGYFDEYDAVYVIPSRGAVYLHKNFNIC